MRVPGNGADGALLHVCERADGEAVGPQVQNLRSPAQARGDLFEPDLLVGRLPAVSVELRMRDEIRAFGKCYQLVQVPRQKGMGANIRARACRFS